MSEKASDKQTKPQPKVEERTTEGDDTAPPGTQEHLGSDRPYEGAQVEPKEGSG